jgi:hypothetical protein
MREIGDEEMDEVIDSLSIVELSQEEAEMISVIDDNGDSLESLWTKFIQVRDPCLIASDFLKEDLEEDAYDDSF